MARAYPAFRSIPVDVTAPVQLIAAPQNVTKTPGNANFAWVETERFARKHLDKLQPIAGCVRSIVGLETLLERCATEQLSHGSGECSAIAVTQMGDLQTSLSVGLRLRRRRPGNGFG
jgi:hypothetical protein